MEATILVVEDDEDVNKLICNQLQKQRNKTMSAFDGEKAIEVFHHNQIDLIILDIMIPSMDGIEVMTKISSLMTGINIDNNNGHLTLMYLTTNSFFIFTILMAPPWFASSKIKDVFSYSG